ncbi:hypothetical protein MVES1_001544 [Malassezia vespertilionis]|uniref:uncharacterized protein n=1 Tax=Malassezia vespertilionis TaxID=2020962 RepID=UPI0024B068D5|nr:uncharacterized protein MVES1_001544 [Malassezia vespertilionis]WFD06202.1 hypothetical protein MVES1_001544 [Malassezia vespertilionis]
MSRDVAGSKARIHLGYHLIPHIVQTVLAELPSSAYVFVTDTNLAKLGVVEKFRDAFAEHNPAGFPARVLVYEVAPGEESKSRATKAAIEDWMLEHRLTRDTVVLACGGGVIGDLVGFVASTFMRGVKYVQIPTTLLAMVDSAVGGKTAIDTAHGKNLIGAFHQPQFVFVDAAWLLTLPPREFSNGMAEVVKTAAIWDAADFRKLETESDAIRSAVLGEAARVFKGDAGRTLETRSEEQTLLLDVIRGSIGVKAHIVTIDEKETGLRNLVNFGHSVGHAIEAVLTPEVLHGECIAVGMILEAEIARFEAGLSQVAIGRLARCLQLYDLPVSLGDARITALSKSQGLTADKLLDIMRVDKKNAGAKKKVVLLAKIGRTVEERASTVSDAVIARILAPAAMVRPLLPVPAKPQATITTPGSKSISNRALLLAALGTDTCRLRNVLHSDDTQVMINALRCLRTADFAFEDDGRTLVVYGHGGRVLPPPDGKPLYLQNAGTAARFLTAVCALQQPAMGETSDGIRITGNARMKERPIAPLVDALCSNGVSIAYDEQEGSLPLHIASQGMQGGAIQLAANVSSQYVSAILLVAPLCKEDVTLELVGGKVISQPYIDMTIAMMRTFGIAVVRLCGADGTPRDAYHIARGAYHAPAVYEIESDASSATYPLALAAITGTQCTISSIGSASLQGDARFAAQILAPMGCLVEQTEHSTSVQGPPPGTLRQLGAVDMEDMTDAFITAAVLFAVAQPGESTRIAGVANQRVKETNRIRAVVEELAKFNVRAVEHGDGVEVFGTPLSALRAAQVHCYDDHRVAMAFSVLAAVAPAPGSIFLEKRCVEKTWPSYWDDVQLKLGVAVAAANTQAPIVAAPMHKKGALCISPLLPSLTPSTYSADATILCIGMRASGKTHVGAQLAQRMQRRFLDADDLFAAEHNIKAYVDAYGWDKFREKETEILDTLLRQYPRDHVISLGGGIVERAESRALLQRFAMESGPVVHIVRDFAAIKAFLAHSNRPAYGEPLEDVYQRRLPYFKACSSVEVLNMPELDTARTLQRVLAVPLGTVDTSVLHRRSYFLSLTFPDVRDALPSMDAWSAGVDLVELRVDLLAADGTPSLERVCEQVTILTAATALPILFTVRSVSQGGRFPDGEEALYFALVRLGLRLGCAFVDVEMHRAAAHLAAVHDHRGHAQLLASFHDLQGTMPWTSSSAARLYAQGTRLGAAVKLIGQARTLQDNLDLEHFRRAMHAHAPAPLIALNMGDAGRLSRVLNTVLTPVTHPALPQSAAPGQLSVQEINQARHLLGLLPSRQFVLLGTPIAHSLSPLIHNTGFALLGLPYRYALHETPDLDGIDALLRAPDFGGASVTIPYKLQIMQYLDTISPEAQIIGAVNTLIPREKDGQQTVHGDNTDWCAIQALAEQHLGAAQGCVALVIGAGGSARAALYAMHRLGATRILLYNRTYEKAAALAAAVPDEWRVAPLASLADAAVQQPSVIVSNVPAHGTCVEGGDADIVLPAALVSAPRGVAIDMAYKPAHTPLLQLADTTNGAWTGVPGIAILLEQAYHQFTHWTNALAPRAALSAAARQHYST